MGFPYFGQPAIFGEPFGMDSGGGQTLADYLAGLYQRAGNVGLLMKLNEAGGSVADNALYTGAPGSEIIGDPEMDDTGFWSKIENPPGDEVTFSGGKATIHRTTATTALSKEPITGFNAGDTYRSLTQVDSTTGILRLADQNGSPIYSVLVAGLNDNTYVAQPSNATRALMLWQATAGDSVVDYHRTHKVGELDAVISAAGVTVNQAGPNGLKAYDFNGSSGVLTTVQRSSINGLTDMTIILRIVPDAVGTNDRLLFKNGSVDVYFNASGQLVAHFDYSGTDAESVTDAAIPTSDTHIAITLSSADKTARIYVDGVEAAYSAQTAGVGTRVSNTNNYLWFKNAGTDGFDGKAVYAALYAAVATEGEVAGLYALRNDLYFLA